MKQNNPLKIIQLSDLHLFSDPQQTLMGVNTDSYYRKVLALAKTQHPDADLLLLTGDLVQQASRTVYIRLADELSEYGKPCICLPGNHDDWGMMKKILNRNKVNCRKLLCYENWQIITLNSQIPGSAGGHVAATEIDFVADAIHSRPELMVFIAVHHHCIPSGSEWMDTMQINNSQTVLAKLQQFPQVKAITSGHIHQAKNSQHGSIRIFSAPATCFQFKPLSKHFAVDHLAPGYRWFKLYGDGQIDSGVSRLDVDMHELDDGSGGY